jgi:hypothetical protein
MRGQVCLVDNQFIYVCTKQTTEPDTIWFNGKVGEFGVAPERVHLLTDDEFTNLNLYGSPFRGRAESEAALEHAIEDILKSIPIRFGESDYPAIAVRQIIALVRSPYGHSQVEGEDKK